MSSGQKILKYNIEKNYCTKYQYRDEQKNSVVVIIQFVFVDMDYTHI